MKRTIKTLLEGLVLLATFTIVPHVAALEPTGTYTINYRLNAGGCYPPNSNPFGCSYIPPGPIRIDAAPGQYHLLTTNEAEGGGNAHVWSGDASSGTDYGTKPVGEVLHFEHTHGQIILFAYDWAPYDNRETTWREVRFVPAFACQGFEPPMDDRSLTVKKNRVLPLKAQVFDGNGLLVRDTDIVAPPVIQVIYNSGVGGGAIDVTIDALSAGKGTEGNQFVLTEDEKWQFNLKTKNYTAPGTYTISMVSGDSSEYMIDPTCETSFVIEE